MSRRPRLWLAALVAALLVVAPPARAATKPPEVDSPAAILVEPATGDIVFQRHAEDRRSIASTTKLMTALLTLEHRRLGETLTTVAYDGSPVESLGGFRGGERVTVADLLRALLLASANDAAATLAQRVGGSRPAFVRMMNARARELGLRDTHFANPIGLDDPQNFSSAQDLVKLTLILRRSAFFREVTNLRRVTIRSGAQPRTYLNRNLVVRDWAPANGVKTGHTSRAGYVLVGSATRDGVTVVSAVLGATSEAQRDADSLRLLRFGLREYHVTDLLTAGRALGHAALAYRDDRVALVAGAGLRLTVRRGEKPALRVVGAPAELDGPLPEAARVGTVVVSLRGREVGRVPLVTAAEVTPAGVLDKAGDFADRNATALALVVAAAASLGVLVVLRRRAVRRRRRRRTNGASVA